MSARVNGHAGKAEVGRNWRGVPAMNCAMCPTWMGGGMGIALLIGILIVVLIAVAIVRLTRA